jgi:hypothetical protein
MGVDFVICILQTIHLGVDFANTYFSETLVKQNFPTRYIIFPFSCGNKKPIHRTLKACNLLHICLQKQFSLHEYKLNTAHLTLNNNHSIK